MKITFTETRRICPNGFDVLYCEAGKTYDIADTMARAAIRQGWAVEAVDGLEKVNEQFTRVFGRTGMLTNPATLLAMGEDL